MSEKLDPIPPGEILLEEFMAPLGLSQNRLASDIDVPVSRIAKWKTTVQLLAIGFLVAGPAGETVLPGTIAIGLALLWVAAALTIWTGWDYMRAGIKHVIDDPR